MKDGTNKKITHSLSTRTKKPEIPSLIYGKMAPQAPDLEGAVLGAVMLEPDKLIPVLTILKSPECFYSDANQRIFTSIRRLNDMGSKIDFMTVCEDLRKNNELEMVGGSYYVTQLTRDVVSSAHIEEHSRIVLQKYILRELIRIGGSAIGDAYENSVDVFDLLDQLDGDLSALHVYATGGQHKALSHIIGQYLEHLQKPHETANMVRTYFREVDRYLGPLIPGCMYVIAARPGMGKTSLLISATLNQSKHIPVGIWNGELTEDRFLGRYMSNILSVDSHQMRNIKDSKNIDVIIDGTSTLLTDHKLFLDCTPSMLIDALVAKIRYWVFVCGVKVVWLDYINLIRVSEEREKYNSREQQMYHILTKLSEVCKQCMVPLIILGQLNRDVLKLADKIPNLGHLKEAGRIEEMVYHVGFIHRPEEYGIMEDEHGSTRGRMDYLIRKNSDGKNNVDIQLMTQPQFFKVYDKDEVEIQWGVSPDINGTPTELPF